MILLASEFGQLALAHYLLLSGVLFVIGLVGFLSRRNLIVMFLCTELMFQAAAIAMVRPLLLRLLGPGVRDLHPDGCRCGSGIGPGTGRAALQA